MGKNTPHGPTVGRCLGPYGGPRGWALFYERGTPPSSRGGPIHPEVYYEALLCEEKVPRRLAAADTYAYRGTSLIRNCASLGPYSRTIPRALWWY